ncbi:hypothetical protein D3C76_767290 [compost metagenome]
MVYGIKCIVFQSVKKLSISHAPVQCCYIFDENQILLRGNPRVNVNGLTLEFANKGKDSKESTNKTIKVIIFRTP